MDNGNVRQKQMFHSIHSFLMQTFAVFSIVGHVPLIMFDRLICQCQWQYHMMTIWGKVKWEEKYRQTDRTEWKIIMVEITKKKTFDGSKPSSPLGNPGEYSKQCLPGAAKCLLKTYYGNGICRPLSRPTQKYVGGVVRHWSTRQHLIWFHNDQGCSHLAMIITSRK